MSHLNFVKLKSYNLNWQFNLILILFDCVCIGIDLVGPLCECNGIKYIVTAVCYFMKFIEAKPIPEKTGHEVASFIYDLLCQYGYFQIAISDQGVCSL